MRVIASLFSASVLSGSVLLGPACVSARAQSAAPATIVSAASPNVGITPDSLASVFGQQISTMREVAPTPWPTRLGDVSVVIVNDSAGNSIGASILFVSPGQMNIWIPPGVAPGPATIAFPVTGLPLGEGAAALRISPVTIQKVAPALFSVNGTGSGVAAASAVQITAGSSLVAPIPVFQCDAAGGNCGAVPISLGIDTPVYLSLYGTGIRGASSLQHVSVTIGNTQIEPTYAGPQPQTPGLDQVNVPLPLTLRGAGLANVTVTVDGVTSNAVQIDIQ